MSERLRHSGHDPRAQRVASRTRFPLRHVVEFTTEPEDVRRVRSGVGSKRGENQALPAPVEQRHAEMVFERPELRAQGRVSEAELASGRGDAAFLGDHREVEQVVIVEPVHLVLVAKNYR